MNDYQKIRACDKAAQLLKTGRYKFICAALLNFDGKPTKESAELVEEFKEIFKPSDGAKVWTFDRGETTKIRVEEARYLNKDLRMLALCFFRTLLEDRL